MTPPETFVLDERLARDCHRLGSFELSLLLLMNDCRYPWFILVPQRPDLREIYELYDDDRRQLLHESCALGQALMTVFGGDKLNVAALGNVVPQLHVHHVVRHRGDAAWPAPVWGKGAPQAYSDRELRECLARMAPHWPSGFRAEPLIVGAP